MRSRSVVLEVALAASLVSCGLAQATPPVVADEPFEGAYAVATDWEPVELGFPEGAARLEVTRLDLVEPRLRQYFSLGVRPIDEGAVSVTMPQGSEAAERFPVLVTVTGGVNDGVSGSQFRVWVSRSGAGWTIENQAEGRRFCRYGTGGFSGRLCVGR
jgi:hypothetical protein